MAVSDDAKAITAALLTVAASLVKIEKRLDKRAVNDESAQLEVMQTFLSIRERVGKS